MCEGVGVRAEEFDTLLDDLSVHGGIVESVWLSPMDVLELLQTGDAIEVANGWRVGDTFVFEAETFPTGRGVAYLWVEGREQVRWFEVGCQAVTLEPLGDIVARLGAREVHLVLVDPHLMGLSPGLSHVEASTELGRGVMHVRGVGRDGRRTLWIYEWVGSDLEVVDSVPMTSALESRLEEAGDHVAYTGHLGWDVQLRVNEFRSEGRFDLRCSVCGFQVEVPRGEVLAAGRADLLSLGGWVDEVVRIQGTPRKARPTDWEKLLGSEG